MILRAIFSHVVGGAAELLASPITHCRNMWRQNLSYYNYLYNDACHRSGDTYSTSSGKAVRLAVKETAKDLVWVNGASAFLAGAFTLPLAIDLIDNPNLIGNSNAIQVLGVGNYIALCIGNSLANAYSSENPVYPIKARLDRALGL